MIVSRTQAYNEACVCQVARLDKLNQNFLGLVLHCDTYIITCDL